MVRTDENFLRVIYEVIPVLFQAVFPHIFLSRIPPIPHLAHQGTISGGLILSPQAGPNVCPWYSTVNLSICPKFLSRPTHLLRLHHRGFVTNQTFGRISLPQQMYKLHEFRLHFNTNQAEVTGHSYHPTQICKVKELHLFLMFVVNILSQKLDIFFPSLCIRVKVVQITQM